MRSISESKIRLRFEELASTTGGRAASTRGGGRSRLRGLALVTHLLELVAVRVSEVVSMPLIDVVARDRSDELVAAHPDVTVEPPHREDDLEAPERAVPGERVLVVRVDERAVDIQQRCAGH